MPDRFMIGIVYFFSTVKNKNFFFLFFSCFFLKLLFLAFCFLFLQTFLLEKIRVVKQSDLERNYHIFYIMSAGASAQDRERWELNPISSYHYTNQSACYDRRDGVKDIDLHVELQEASHVFIFHTGVLL